MAQQIADAAQRRPYHRTGIAILYEHPVKSARPDRRAWPPGSTDPACLITATSARHPCRVGRRSIGGVICPAKIPPTHCFSAPHDRRADVRVP
jgi:hypothetical protein